MMDNREKAPGRSVPGLATLVSSTLILGLSLVVVWFSAALFIKGFIWACGVVECTTS